MNLKLDPSDRVAAVAGVIGLPIATGNSTRMYFYPIGIKEQSTGLSVSTTLSQVK